MQQYPQVNNVTVHQCIIDHATLGITTAFELPALLQTVALCLPRETRFVIAQEKTANLRSKFDEKKSLLDPTGYELVLQSHSASWNRNGQSWEKETSLKCPYQLE